MGNSSRSNRRISKDMEPRVQSAYASPQVTDWGTVTKLTNTKGMTHLTDTEMTGSMEHRGP